MNKIIEDYKNEGFTLREWTVYGVLTMAAAFICIIAGVIE